MDGATTYALMIAGGDYPDCWGSKLSDYYSSYDTALEEDVIIDLTDLISEYMPSYTAALAGDQESGVHQLHRGRQAACGLSHQYRLHPVRRSDPWGYCG